MTSGTRPKMTYGRLLVVEDEEASRRTLTRMVQRYRPVRHARDCAAARAEMDSRRDWCGFLFDVCLGDRPLGGLELLDIVTTEFPGVPAAILTGNIEPAIVNRAAALGATMISKPAGEAELGPFLQRVIAREHGFARQFAERFEGISRAWRLSPREHEILAWFVAGQTREGYLAFAGMAETTFKTHVKHVLSKTQSGSLAEVVAAALRSIVVEGGAAPELLRRK